MMGIPVLAGRDFNAEDDERAPKRVVVSESLARRYFPEEDPLGRQIAFGETAATIVGVVKDVRFTNLRGAAPLFTYRAYRQDRTAPANTFFIRTATSVEFLTPFLRAEMHAAAPTLPPPSILKMEDQVAAALLEERMLAALPSAFGVLAAILAADRHPGFAGCEAPSRDRDSNGTRSRTRPDGSDGYSRRG